MQLTKLGTFWATWKLKIIAGVAILAALAIAIYAAHNVGYTKGKNISESVIATYEIKLAELKSDAIMAQAKVDTVVVTQYKDRLLYQDRIVTKNRDIIVTKIVDRPIEQSVTKGWIYAHNQSALGFAIDPNKAADDSVSLINDSTILDVVAQNYAIDQRNVAKLESLQKWVKDTADAAKKINQGK